MDLTQRPVSDVPLARARGALRWPVAAGLAATAGVLLVAAVDPNESGHYPTCPFLAMSGLYCPGCGSMRAVYDLAHGDLGGAMARNPLTVITLAVALVAYAAWWRSAWRGERRRWVAPAWLLPAVVAVIVGFTVARNVPGWTWLSPA